jgi:hypothetical protein
MEINNKSKKHSLKLVKLVVFLLFVGVLGVFLTCRTCRPEISKEVSVLSAADVDNAYCALIDVRGRLQMALRSDSNVRYNSLQSFTNAYPDKSLGNAMPNQYTLLADLGFNGDNDYPLPPLLSLPIELMNMNPNTSYPVLLLCPQDNKNEQAIHLVRVAFLTKKDIDKIVLSDTGFSLEDIQEKYQIKDGIENPVWHFYAQKHIFEYLDTNETH